MGLTAILWVYACGDGGMEPLPANPPRPISLAVTPATADLAAIGATVHLNAEVLDEHGQPMADAGITWSSSDTTVATVDPWGLVTAAGYGTATITAVGSVSATSTVTVAQAGNSDRVALVALYEATDGPNWVNNENWLTDAPLGEWFGVETDSLGRVVRLEMTYYDWDRREWIANNLSGPLPAELGNLAELERLYLQSNRLTGPIPSELGKLAKLERLYLDNNGLAGPIPSELGNLSNLERLYLYSNNLTGPIPTELAALAKLQRLYLDNNGFTGAIPSEFGSLANLERLYLDNNSLKGAVPSELGSLANLERLYLYSNGLTGPIPHSFLGLDQLHSFRIERNESLCVPGVAAFSRWLQGIESRDEAAISCNATDVAVLTSLFDQAGGGGWTNSGGWLNDFALAEWYGVSADSLGHVTAVDLESNGLSGPLVGALGDLDRMTGLRIGDNALAGRLPRSLIDLPLRDFRYAGTELCAPTDGWFRAWLSTIPSHDGTGLGCAPLTDREALEAVYDATNGPGWTNNNNWLTDAPLGEWYGVEADDQGRVVGIGFVSNGLTGRIPREIGGLAHLEWLRLYRDELTGPIPPELGSLANLRSLTLSESGLIGPIPPELGNLANLRTLRLHENRLTGPIPHELGTLSNLLWVNLNRNRLTGRIPSELGGLTNLRELALGGNELTGPIPSELAKLVNLRDLNLATNRLTGTVLPGLGNLDRLEVLYLGENGLTGPVPPEFGGLASLRHLALQKNAEMSGALPDSLTNLSVLETLQAGGTGLCSPSGPGFREWLAGVPNRRVAPCEGEAAMAYLVQATQSREFPVPLVSGEEALLRVFVTAGRDNAERLPPVRASFTLDGTLAHVANIPGKPGPIPTEVEEGSLAVSANALIPAEVVRPGLELVIEIDPDGTLDPGLGVAKRIPEAGRLPVEVREMPVLGLTLIPFLWAADPDSAILEMSAEMAADPDGHEMLADAQILLAVRDIDVIRHEPVVTSSNSTYAVHAETNAIRALEGGSGHWMALMSGTTIGGGLGSKPGWVSTVFKLNASTIAHELGHNMSLSHAPGRGNPDPAFPYRDGSSGVWGYDSRERQLVPPDVGDLMGPRTPNYADRGLRSPRWISDYHFAKALAFRLTDEGRGDTMSAESAPSLLLWGGTDAEGEPYLEPAFAVNAPPALPKSGGEYRVTGRSVDGTELFSLAFAMPETPHAGNASSFAFVLPANGGWRGALATITLSGSGGTFTLDADSDTPMAIVRDPRTQAVRAILRGVEDADVAQAAAMSAPGTGTDSALEVLFSRGLPDFAAWGR